MLSLADFKKLVADDIKNLSEKEIEVIYAVSTTFANVAYKKWSENKLLKKEKKC